MENLCSGCGNGLNGFLYCGPCNSGHFRDNFSNWTSGHDSIDQLIKELQLNAVSYHSLLEWIEFSKLRDVEHIAEGGFGRVYKAIWEDGPLSHGESERVNFWDEERREWIREGETQVAIKKYRNATNVSSDFMNEVNKIKVIIISNDSYSYSY